MSGSSRESSFDAKIMFSHTCLIVASLTVEIKILFAQFSPTISMNFPCESVELHSDNDDDDEQLFVVSFGEQMGIRRLLIVLDEG